MEYICIGKIVNTHGIRGELKIQSYSDFDADRYKKGNTVYIEHEGSYVEMKTATFRTHKGMSLVSFADHQNINDVEKYKEDLIYVDKQDRKPLTKGSYYRDQLVDLTAVDEEGNTIGTVLAVEETLGAQNNLRIRKEDDSEVLVPYVPVFVKNVDLDEKKIVIHVVEGLL